MKFFGWLRSKRKELKVSALFLLTLLLLAGAVLWAWHDYKVTPPYIDPERFPVKGVDLSSHNGLIDMEALARDGIDFVFLKASEGVDFHDRSFALNFQKAARAGLKIGAYHFFRFDRDGVDQAKNLMRAVAGRSLPLGIVIDVEDAGNPKDVPRDSILTRLNDMVEYLTLSGVRVTFYSNRDGYEKYLYDTFPGAPLWVCQFTDNSMNRDWTFWQYDHHGEVAGVKGDVDLNVFCGSREEWEEKLLADPPTLLIRGGWNP